MATYGYARVSSSNQSTDIQIQRLKAAGCQVVRTEKLSGKSREGRDQLATLLEFIGPGDVLVYVKLDRLGRSTRDVLNLVHELDQKGAFLRIFEPPFRPMDPWGKWSSRCWAWWRKWSLASSRPASATGLSGQNPRVMSDEGRKPTIDRSAVLHLFNEGIGASEIARRLKIGRASVYRVLEL